jgi:hypothetical protein
MGGVLAALVFKSGTDTINLSPENIDKVLWDYTLKNIDNQPVRLGDVVSTKKAVLFVNVASK